MSNPLRMGLQALFDLQLELKVPGEAVAGEAVIVQAEAGLG